ncbi:aminotransferase class I/II-fold pyridoxal phosphate-dependent enzyme [Thermocoleostomius sinensis]|uniref:Aminotransferase class I/II-fold pyridoxal phosphate-dependent enzyme n=1 Tax=Thermocoleostomius sinensis A174 TaxID=2016057 RepID=A0A9E8ZJI7_9CYAN|nr:aminotransferase class I/II-fold pyridoxal phosphate-dependent enzyme [Thermocoleostomius sinensis]WAL62879.1 aminotransferase class I/II-fold pyridoxal phosphate-dependent enzyme [Thermocoleostomius sinensis A174]
MKDEVRQEFDPRQASTPLLDRLKTCAQRSSVAFHTPGHKRGQGISANLRDWLGQAVFQADLPELPELDNLFAPKGVIQQAQVLAAAAFGAEQTWFLANGSTCGIEAAVLATCQPGDKIVLPRNVHQSAIAALILSGAIPIYVQPDYDAEWDVAHGVSPTTIKTAIAQHPDAKAVLIVSPTYYGVTSPVQEIAEIVHQHDIPLLVDEAHGAHFAFHPDLPPSALSQGADLAVQSIHKTLSALTQAAMLHVQGDRIDRDRLTRCLSLVQSTSPNYLLLASLDAARQQMAIQGQPLMEQALSLSNRVRQELEQISGLLVLADRSDLLPGFAALDWTRITIDVIRLGLTGFAADEILHETFGVTAELPGLRHLTFILTFGNTNADIDRLVSAFRVLSTLKPQPQLESHCLSSSSFLLPPFSLPPLTPRQAFFSAAVTLPIAHAIDRISAELVCPYPPGIPVLLPGEVITTEAIEYLQQVLAAGGVVAGCTDSTLETLRIVNG